MARNPHDCLVVINISSRRISATVAWMREDLGEQIVAHRPVQCRWSELNPAQRSQAILDVLQLARESAQVEPYSVFVAMSDPSLRANYATGHTDLGQIVTFTPEDRDLAFVRACKQAIGTNRKDLHGLQPVWTIRDQEGDHIVDDPVGHRGSFLRCEVLLVTADRAQFDYMHGLLASNGITLEGMIAPPVALYRSISGSLPKRGSTVIIDFGARNTSFIVHRKGKLIYLETNPFGSDDLTEEIAAELGIPLDKAEALKYQVDFSIHTQSREQQDYGQTFLWQDVEEQSRHLVPAARVCSSHMRRFLRERCNHLKDAEVLSHTGRVHLFGRGAALGGLSNLVREIFAMETVLGSRHADRDPSSELGDAITVGLVRAAAQERRRQLAQRRASSSFHQVASVAGGLFTWLLTPMS